MSPTDTVGNGTDWLAQYPTQSIDLVTGLFPAVYNVASEHDSKVQGGGSNYWSLQINTNWFQTSTLYTNNYTATGFVQFVFSNDPGAGSRGNGSVLIQLWLIGFYTAYDTCPSVLVPGAEGVWIPVWPPSGYGPVDCVVTIGGESTPLQSFSSLTGFYFNACADCGGMMEASFCNSQCYTASTFSSVLELYSNWNSSEFNIFGYGDASQAVFNPGAIIDVENWPGLTNPSCAAGGYTAETNSLTLVQGTCVSSDEYITFTESNGTQHLTMNAGSGGSVSPTSGYQTSGSIVTITATGTCQEGIREGTVLKSWSGTGDVSYSGGSPTARVTMDSAISETASFTRGPCPQVLTG